VNAVTKRMASNDSLDELEAYLEEVRSHMRPQGKSTFNDSYLEYWWNDRD